MGSDINQVKAMLRAQLREALEDLTDEERAESDAALAEQFLSHPKVQEAGTIMLFWGVGTEPRTDGIVSALLEQGKKICLPKCLPEHEMEARLITSADDLEPDKYGIPAPKDTCPVVEKESLDLILVPGLCFDAHGSRLGQGGGYYDRYLEDCEVLTIGLCREDFLQAYLPREPFDAWVRYILTEEGQVWPNKD